MAGSLRATGITRSYGSQVVLQDVSLTVAPGDRIGVVGPNGAGKSTLLRVLSGAEPPDGGTVTRAPRALRVGSMPQEPDGRPGETVMGYLARRTGVAAAEAEVDRLADRMDDVHAYTEALDRFVALGGDDLHARAGAVCAKVGLPADRLDVEVRELSAGQASRAALAAILLARVDVLLLDEPTNDLDFEGLAMLEAFMEGSGAGVVVVSHDRAFLDRAVTRIVELDGHMHRATVFAGAWSDYVAARALARDQASAAHGRYVAERTRLEERVRRQRAWSDKGLARIRKMDPAKIDRKTKQGRIETTENLASKVRATERMLDRLEAVEKPWEGWRLQMSLVPGGRSGDMAVRLRDAVVRRGTFTLGPVSVEVASGEKVAIVGPNGAGKTTMLRAIVGDLPLDSGERYLGPGVTVGQLSQERELFSGDTTVLETFVDATEMQPSASRTLLAKFALGPEHVLRTGRSLSPGERTRAVLAALVARGTNLLVLDEPTNHLDLEAIEQLEGALAGFPGTVLLVTHDRWLLEHLSLDRTIRLG